MIITPNAVAYVATLNNIGLNPAQIATFDMITGISDVRIFHSVDDTQKYFDSVAKQIRVTTPFPFTVASSVIAFRHWVNFMVARKQDPDPSLFAVTPDHRSKWTTRKSEILENRLLSASLSELQLNKFTEMDKWNAFRGDVRAKLQSYRDSKYGIFLSVLVREHTDVTPEMLAKTYDSLEDELSETIDLSDPFLDRDNKYLFAAISECTSTGPLNTYIRKFENKGDGRGAYLELLTACNNPEMKDLRKEKLKDRIRNTKWTRHMSIKKYTQSHIEIHNLMADAGVDFSETDKIYWYIFNSKSHDIGNNIALAMATQTAPTTFDACVASFRRAMANNDNTPRESETRRISASERNPRRTDNRQRSQSTGTGTRRSKPVVPPKGAADCPPGYLTKHGYQPKKIFGWFTDNPTIPIHLETYKSDVYDLILKSEADRTKLQEVRAANSRQVKAVETLERNLTHRSWRDDRGDYHLQDSIAHQDDSSIGSTSVTSHSLASHSSYHSQRSNRQAASLSTSQQTSQLTPTNQYVRAVHADTSVNQFGHPRHRRVNNNPAWTSNLEATKRADLVVAAVETTDETPKSSTITWDNDLKPAANPLSPSESVAYIEAKKEAKAKRAKERYDGGVRRTIAKSVSNKNTYARNYPQHNSWGGLVDGSWDAPKTTGNFCSKPSVKRTVASSSRSPVPTDITPFPTSYPAAASMPARRGNISVSPTLAITQAAAMLVQAASLTNYDSDSDDDAKPAYDITQNPVFLSRLAAITAILDPTSVEPTTALEVLDIATDAPLATIAPSETTNSDEVSTQASYSTVSALTTVAVPVSTAKRVRKPTPTVPFNTSTRNSKRKDPPQY